MSVASSLSFDQAVALAKAGDVHAQYALSSELHQREQFEESLHWLRMAAGRGLISAQMTLATILMDGRLCPRDLQQAIDLLRPLAASQIKANLLLGELYGFAAFHATDREIGLRFLLAAALGGDAAATRQFALLCVCHRRWDLVRPLLDASARGGDGAATYALATCYGAGVGGAPDRAVALALAHSEAARAEYLGPRLRDALRLENPAATLAPPPALRVDWLSLEQSLPQLAAAMPLPPVENLHPAPLIRKLPGVIHPLVLDSLINLAAPLVQRSQIVDARTGQVRADPMRNSSHVTLGPRQHDHVLEALEHCISLVSGVPAGNGEFLQILRYRPGEEFKPHVDYFNEGGAGAYDSLAAGGQRAQTVLMYLNDEYSGGETRFPHLRLNIKGGRGDILHFHNLGADGLGHRDSLHSGVTVTALEKWLLSQWIRVDRYRPRSDW
jgi:prolyl 4-hydroxylase